MKGKLKKSVLKRKNVREILEFIWGIYCQKKEEDPCVQVLGVSWRSIDEAFPNLKKTREGNKPINKLVKAGFLSCYLYDVAVRGVGFLPCSQYDAAVLRQDLLDPKIRKDMMVKLTVEAEEWLQEQGQISVWGR